MKQKKLLAGDLKSSLQVDSSPFISADPSKPKEDATQTEEDDEEKGKIQKFKS